MSVLNENQLIGASAGGDYEIEQSLRFEDSNSPILDRTPASASKAHLFYVLRIDRFAAAPQVH